ncbi:MAG: hypothetical protein Q7W45_18060 [Bacteroidota bacterium]|nr:hypothetical protein [Bacteroidota bacterium]MDP3146376.1 hypothetical protein [Bacteroidota bacterium]
MKLIYLLIILFVYSGRIFSQNDNQNSRPKDIKDNPQYLKAVQMEQNHNNPNILVSEYFGYESKITPLFVNDLIPSSFPKSIGYTDKEKYRETINIWLKENQSLVKPDKKNSLISE